jgi:hypothetical protein
MVRSLCATIVLGILFAHGLFAQKYGVEFPIGPDGRITFSQVVNLDSTTMKKEIFLKLRSWCASTLADSKMSIILEDAEAGLICGKGAVRNSFDYLFTPYSDLWSFDFKLEAKDGRYRYTFNTFHYNSESIDTKGWDGIPAESFYFDKPRPMASIKLNTKMLNQLNDNTLAIIESLMNTMSSIGKNDDW